MKTKLFLTILLFSLLSITSYSQGEPPKNYSGAWVTKYKNGQINFKGKYVNGKAVGEGVYYFENGQIRFIGSYVDGLKEGKWLAYFENGVLRYKVNYSKGDQVGERIYY